MLNTFHETQLAFDSVAADYDGPLGNNALIQAMRIRTLNMLQKFVAAPAHLLDLGCGTGLDLAVLAEAGYKSTGIDSSPRMVERARARLNAARLEKLSCAMTLGFEHIDQLAANAYDGAYSDLGALNCVADLSRFALALHRLLKPGGILVASVIGRFCPWEFAYYIARGKLARAGIRFSPGHVQVPLNEHVVWTRYFWPAEFEQSCAAAGFQRVALRALSLFVPPPYMIAFAERHPLWIGRLQALDDALGGLPLLRNFGDHFLVAYRKAA